MEDNDRESPWVSFCISTYKRPILLKEQLALLLRQTNENFEIVVSDNDPEGSAAPIVDDFQDKRLRYFRNDENLGMIRSFNKSIDRARTDYVTMVTDDDPVDTSFLDVMRALIKEHPGYSLYGGFLRQGKNAGNIERIEKKSFLAEILDPLRTSSILWSSCVLRRADVIQAGKIPDYGSPHLADHALIVMTGSAQGGVLINHMYSELTQHGYNFSKLNFETYVTGCKGFYETLSKFIQAGDLHTNSKVAIRRHLYKWFIDCVFNLKKYYSLDKNKSMLMQVDSFAKKILDFDFMKNIKPKYYFKGAMLYIKIVLGLLKK
jgi:glycosyltransferase involved in cell wall biosynthesis